jgi:hypothetical protein
MGPLNPQELLFILYIVKQQYTSKKKQKQTSSQAVWIQSPAHLNCLAVEIPPVAKEQVPLKNVFQYPSPVFLKSDIIPVFKNLL